MVTKALDMTTGWGNNVPKRCTKG